MKLSLGQIILLAVFCNLALAGELSGQETKSVFDTEIALHLKDASAKEAFAEIENQTGFSFSFEHKSINARSRLNLREDNLGDALAEISRQLKINFRQLNSTISVAKADVDTGIEPVEVVIIDKNISGTVTEAETGEPLIGATVQVKGTDIGNITGIDGSFELVVPDDAELLVISYLGFQTKEVRIGDQSSFDIVIQQDADLLNEVVVVGYSTQQTYKVTSAVQQVSSEDLEIDKRPVSNLESGLFGSVHGLILEQSNGQLGTDIDIQVRSVASINNNDALILVDGIESSIQNINPNDIASVSILKDASATSIYGTKGANGVVLITTKEGKKGENLSVTFNTNFSWQAPGNTAQMLNSQQFMEAFNAARFNENPNLGVLYTDEDIARAASGFYPETNWVDELYNETATQSSQNLSVSGGSENTSYKMSVGYLSQDGISQGPENLEIITFWLKLDSDINDWMTIGANVFNANRTLNRVPVATNNGLRGQPFYPVRLDTGRYAGTYVFKGSTSNEENPIAKANSGSYDERISDELNVQLYTKLYPFEGFSLEGRVSYIKTTEARTMWDNPYEFIFLEEEDLSLTGPPVPFTPEDRSLQERNSNSRRVNTWLLANYNRTFGDGHNFDALGGFQAESEEGSIVVASRQGFILDNLQSLGLGTSVDPDLPFGNDSQVDDADFLAERSVVSYFTRLSYDYNGKYLAEFSLRADASSNFVNNRWAVSPALALGWNIHDEMFMSNLSWVNVLKLRSSWGFNADDNIEVLNSDLVANREVVDFNPSGIGFGTEVRPTILLDNAINPDLTWETSEKFNVGLDLAFWEGKLTFNGDYFIDNRRDVIAAVQTSIEGGLTTVNEDGEILGGILDNVYDARSSGWEMALGHNNKIGPVDVSAGVNFSYYNSELLEGPDQIFVDDDGNDKILGPSTPILGSLYGYETAGYFNTEEDI
ncbi:MAG: SusC/RagA family TonB-linked outer membrane protein, partial [Bacteroidota bacterium]